MSGKQLVFLVGSFMSILLGAYIVGGEQGFGGAILVLGILGLAANAVLRIWQGMGGS